MPGGGEVARQLVPVHLDSPPRVVSLGVGVHGKVRRRDVFQLPDLWQLHLYRYSADLTVDGVAHAIHPGYVSLIPPGALVRFLYRGRSEHLYAHLRLPEVGSTSGAGPASRAGSAGGAGPVGSSGLSTVRMIPVVQDGGADVPILSDLLLQALAGWPSTPAQAAAEVWVVLWRLAQLAAPTETERPHAAVSAAISYIESNLASPLTVPEVARAVDISHNHLTRLFRAETGGTVVAHIRRRRMDRARHLLRDSTLSIATIATSVGIPDLQAFNKACRRELGASPRAVRGGQGSAPT
ncbi:helix-turn-helix domain-containing protein [Actinopolymorpha alba]|uniref:helix-turn-helix domain-containing protein n=1 Tax=Actinopolymorpha alba TaxID=533267 RepID=UPI0003A84B1A|nr:AraC family transcriptional regulator [Actinopolymorpha alba]